MEKTRVTEKIRRRTGMFLQINFISYCHDVFNVVIKHRTDFSSEFGCGVVL